MTRLGLGRSLLIVALLLGTLVTPSAAKSPPEPPVLARVDTAGSLAALGLPVYAGLQDVTGQDYALVIAPLAQLQGSGVKYAVLDTGTLAGERYVIARTRRAGTAGEAAARVRVLHDDGRQLIARATADEAASLSPLGYDYSWLPAEPLDLRAVNTPVATGEFIPDPIVAEMIDQVEQSAVQNYGNILSGETETVIGGTPYTILTRNTNSGTSIQKATQYVYEFMQSLGLGVSYHNFATCAANRNVVGVLPGTTMPQEVVLVTAHLDDMPSGPRAPGADDNGSGSVGVMLAAQIMSQYSFERTVRFVFFTGEEQGLCGSEAYAAYVHGLGENLVAVYNMDMIAYDALDGPTLRIHTRTLSDPGYPADLAIASVFTNVVSTYGLASSLTPIIDPDGISASDHASFWQEGYAAVLAIEDDNSDFNAYYHTIQDTMAHNNLAYFTAYVKASLGTAGHLAMPAAGSGTLSGLVRNASTLAPISGALVEAARTIWPYRTTTNASGLYTMHVASGTYTMTAQAYGSLPVSVSGIQAVAGVTTTQNFDLPVAPTHVIGGFVWDALTGLPLSARIDITGAPVSPPAPYNQVTTNPATGYYSATLAEGIAYTFTVTSLVPGYLPAGRFIGAVTSNRTENFGLRVDARVCIAPGYHQVGGLYQAFDGGTLPAGWTNIDNQGSGQVWQFNDPGGRGNLTGGSGLFAIIDSDNYGSGGQQNTALRSPVIDLSSYVTATLQFDTDFYHYGADVADVDVSVNGAAGPWTNVWHKIASYRGPRHETVNLTALAAGQANVMVRFHFYNGSYGWWWQVDNFEAGPVKCPPDITYPYHAYLPVAARNAP